MLQRVKSIIAYGVLPCILWSGLFLNILQLLVYCIIRPLNEQLFRKINHKLQYSYWSQTVAVVDFCTNVECRVTYKDSRTKDEFGTCSGLVISNHRYDVDWLAAWMLSDKLGTLGNDKSILKSSLKSLPVIGWGWALNDMMFVSRDWSKDKKSIAKTMDRLLTYENSFLLAFLEGTRFTEEKHRASLEYAEKNNIPLRLKHHVLPRVRGFHLLVQRIKNGLEQNPDCKYGVYNFQVGIDHDGPVSMTQLLSGGKAKLHIYVEKLDIDKNLMQGDLSEEESEQAAKEYLYKLYQTKDDLHEYFMKNKQFPGIQVPYKGRTLTLMNWVFWMIVIYVTFFYFLLSVLHQGFTDGFTTTGITFLVLTTIFLVIMYIVIPILINTTRVSRSSSYGVTDKKST